MTPEQRQALTESLAHWEENVRLSEKGYPPQIWWNQCACCLKWYNHPYNCEGCPISQVTGRSYCDGTWYADVSDAIDARSDTEEFCRLERDWLKLILDSEVDDNG